MILAGIALAALLPSLARASGLEEPQAAIAEDMKIFEPYIGAFRSSTHLFDDGKTEHHFIVSYEWFDQKKSIVKYVVSTVIPSQDRTILNSEGFYGFDPFDNRLYVLGAFRNGMTGFGSVGVFDHESGARETWAKSKGADGGVTYVRDGFQLIDADRWRNTTRIKIGDAGEWKVVSEDVYTRIREPPATP